MRRGLTSAGAIGVLAAVLMVAWPAVVVAQSVGVGARLAFVSGGDSPVLQSTNESKGRFLGGFARVRLGRVSLEAALDYRKTRDDAQVVTISSYPFQGSLLYHMAKGPSGIYLLVGVGYYTQRLTARGADDGTASTSAHSVGYHAGAGLEMALGRRVSFFSDYRYTFVDPPTFSDLAKTFASFSPLLSSTGAAEGLDNKGSMWTTGLMIRF